MGVVVPELVNGMTVMGSKMTEVPDVIVSNVPGSPVSVGGDVIEGVNVNVSPFVVIATGTVNAGVEVTVWPPLVMRTGVTVGVKVIVSPLVVNTTGRRATGARVAEETLEG